MSDLTGPRPPLHRKDLPGVRGGSTPARDPIAKRDSNAGEDRILASDPETAFAIDVGFVRAMARDESLASAARESARQWLARYEAKHPRETSKPMTDKELTDSAARFKRGEERAVRHLASRKTSDRFTFDPEGGDAA